MRDWVRPNQVRLNADPRFAGRGVTVAFVDAGFHPHADLLLPTNRIKAYYDATTEQEPLGERKPECWNWHGTMTSVIACGSGHLSGGIYSGLARQSEVVLVKVAKNGSIRRRNVALGMKWLLENRERLDLRVINISLGLGQHDRESSRTLVDYWVKKAVDAGVVVVVAAGNDGGPVESPAKAAEALTVGGIFDHVNQLYHFNHGTTPDGVHKPDILAPAVLVASPILWGTPQQKRAEALVRLLNDPSLIKELWRDAQLPLVSLNYNQEELISELQGQIAGQKVVSPYYEHADGTSVAAPLVTSVVAQMLEADPGLTPAQVRAILVSTASRLDRVSHYRQGHGVMRARRALEVALDPEHPVRQVSSFGPRQENGKLHFLFHHTQAQGVSLAGDFNNWDPKRHSLEKSSGGVWQTELASPPPGRYRYKFLVDGQRWCDDPWNAHKEPDAWGGLNSIVLVS